MKRKHKKYIKIIVAVLILIFTSIYKLYEEQINNYIYPSEQRRYEEVSQNIPNLEVIFLDVGQADSTLIRYKDKNILIDAGNNNDEETLVNYFKSLNIETFEYAFASHQHEDHIGGMDKIVTEFNINNFVTTEFNKKIKYSNDLEKAILNKNINIIYPNIDDEINIDELKFKILNIDNDKEDMNKNSIIMKLTYKNNSFMFTGDAPKEKELEILDKNLKSDVLKVAHHGSKYSSSAQFITKVRPEYAVISVGEDNKYNHPHQITLDKLEYIKTKIYETRKDKTIKFISDGNNLNIEKIDININNS